jgi:hypothetical protein
MHYDEAGGINAPRRDLSTARPINTAGKILGRRIHLVVVGRFHYCMAVSNDLSIHLNPPAQRRQMPLRGAGIRCNQFIYRVIEPSHSAMWRTIFQQGIVSRLFDQGLIVETTLVENQTGPMLRQAALAVESCPHEWCAAMLRDAARTLLDGCIQLARRGYALNRIDAATMQFDGARAVVADLTSLTPIGEETTWLGYPEFAARFLYPLVMMVHGHDAAARRHLASGGVSGEMLRHHVPLGAIPSSLRTQWRSQSMLAKIGRPIWRWWHGKIPVEADGDSRQRDGVVRKLQWAREELEEIATGIGMVPDRQLPAVDARLMGVVESLNPGRILQWGGGSAISGFDSIICYTEPTSADRWFGIAQTHRLSLVPLVVDLSQPLPQSGKPAVERLRSELLIVPAAEGLLSPLPSTLNAHLDWLTQWTDRWLLIQLPREWPSAPARLAVVLQKRFTSVVTLSADAENGPLLLCER